MGLMGIDRAKFGRVKVGRAHKLYTQMSGWSRLNSLLIVWSRLNTLGVAPDREEGKLLLDCYSLILASYLKLVLPGRSHRGWLLSGNASSCWTGSFFQPFYQAFLHLSKAIVSLVVTTFDNFSKAFVAFQGLRQSQLVYRKE